jgi:DNA-binding beta-propeller fold protein YncE
MEKYFAVLSMLLFGFAAAAHGQTLAPLKLIQTIPLPGVPGALDHMAIDVRGQRLFVPAEQHQTVEVIDLRAGKRIRTLSDVLWPSTIAYNPQTSEIFVTDRSGGSIKVFNGETYELVKTIELIPGAGQRHVRSGYRDFLQYQRSTLGGASLYLDRHHQHSDQGTPGRHQGG